MASPNAGSENSAHSRRAGDGPPYCSIPSRNAPAQRIPTRCLPYGRASIPSAHSHPHCPSTSSAGSPANWGSRWRSPTQDLATLGIADELETGRHTPRFRCALLSGNVPQTNCLPHSRVRIPNPRSNSHSSSTSLAASPAAWGSRWHHPTRDQQILAKLIRRQADTEPR